MFEQIVGSDGQSVMSHMYMYVYIHTEIQGGLPNPRPFNVPKLVHVRMKRFCWTFAPLWTEDNSVQNIPQRPKELVDLRSLSLKYFRKYIIDGNLPSLGVMYIIII